MNDHTSNSERPYVVGYRKPPKATQFKKGNTAQSGAKKPKSAKAVPPEPGSILEMMAATALQKVDVKKGGKIQKTSFLMAFLTQYISTLPTCSKKDQLDFLKLLLKESYVINELLDGQKAAPTPYSPFTPEQEAKFCEIDKEFLIGYCDSDDPLDGLDEGEIDDLDEGSL